MGIRQGIRGWVRRLFYRSEAVRAAVAMVSLMRGRSTPIGVSHLASYEGDEALGPVQRDEALLLFALVRTTMPRVVVEFGFRTGHSAFNFLRALPPDAMVYSYDTSSGSGSIAALEFAHFPNFRFLSKPQQQFDPADIEHREIDFVFFDAAHEFDANRETWSKLAPLLAEHAIVAVHDTGTWAKSHFASAHAWAAESEPGRWLNEEEYEHQSGERQFVNWIVETSPEYCVVQLHTLRALRHGLTLLQKRWTLDTCGDRPSPG